MISLFEPDGHHLFSPTLCNFIFYSNQVFTITVWTVKQLDGMVDTVTILPRPDEKGSRQANPSPDVLSLMSYWAQFILQNFYAKLIDI